MQSVLHALQIINGLAWLVVLTWLCPAIPRIIIGRPTGLDVRSVPIVLYSAAQVFGALRWYIFPFRGPAGNIEITFWAGVWFLNILAAGSVFVIRRAMVKP